MNFISIACGYFPGGIIPTTGLTKNIFGSVVLIL
jgi:hypothetical protein